MKLKLDKNQKKLRLQIIKLIYKAGRSHIGSCLNSVDIIDSFYKVKKNKETFVLSNGHSAMALYAVLIKYKKLKDSDFDKSGIHPDRDLRLGIEVSTGSLGQGLPIAVGMALSNRRENVYCLISDGECTEGSIWESLRIIKEQNILNLKLVVSANGWGAYSAISDKLIEKRFRGFGFQVKRVAGHDQKKIEKYLINKNKTPTIILADTDSDQLPFLKGQDAHYYTMTEDDYNLALNYFK